MKTRVGCCLCLLVGAGTISIGASPGKAEPLRTEVVSFHGYDDCVLLANQHTRVILCPAAGGRVLEYSWKGVNALYLGDEDRGWRHQPGKRGGAMLAGRFDIGPEQTIPAHPMLWKGPWKATVNGPGKATMTSVADRATGVQLIREFQLSGDSSQLVCRQTIRNTSKQTVEYCHWSRTFAQGGGIVVVPLTAPSRFPAGYVMYTPAPLINFRPQDSMIHRREGFLEIRGAPQYAKLGMDSQAGWLAYLMRNDLMFVKRFPVYPDWVYNEVAGLTLSVWYPKDRPMCELEPIGPRERLAPGQQASFARDLVAAGARISQPPRKPTSKTSQPKSARKQSRSCLRL